MLILFQASLRGSYRWRFSVKDFLRAARFARHGATFAHL